MRERRQQRTNLKLDAATFFPYVSTLIELTTAAAATATTTATTRRPKR